MYVELHTSSAFSFLDGASLPEALAEQARTLGYDTLAITVWEATKDSRLDAAALPALLIVLVGLLPVIVLVRLLRSEGWTSAAETFS